MSLTILLAFSIAVGADAEAFTSDLPQGDPVLPPALRQQQSRDKPSSGDELRQQVMQKLKARFDAADSDHNARLTLEEAKAAGLGFVAQHFAEIDTAKRGSVSFEEVRKYMQSRR